MNTIDYSIPSPCGPCADFRCAQYGCIKKMFIEPPNLVKAQPNITQPYNTNHVAALEMIVKLAGENAVLQKENEELQAVVNIPKNILERFERLASRMVSEGYAQGYREACNHIMHETMEKLGKSDEMEETR
jgi:hypothetical protein